MIGLEHVVIDPADLRGEGVRLDPELGDDIDKGADAALQLKEFVEDHHFSLFEDTIAALKIASFVAHDIARFVQDPLYLI
jgi:hypothetical protein